ncbi:MAG: hypothetical protein J5525_12250 [Lachnospiraceae bacterium]|nr:hypothetical protein [Lachnospiraceae bacterium]
MTYMDVLSMNSYDMIDYLTETFLVQIPKSINSIEDMNHASELLLKLSTNYSYMNSLLSYIKLTTRDAKRQLDKLDAKDPKKVEYKTYYEDMVDKKEIINNITECVDQEYSAISRAVTIKIENNKELSMSMR